VAKTAKLFQSPQERKTVGIKTVIAISLEMTSGRGMFWDVDGRQAEKGKNEHSMARNSKGWTLRRETNNGWQSIDEMVECVANVSTTSEVNDGQAGRRHKLADSATVCTTVEVLWKNCSNHARVGGGRVGQGCEREGRG